jgi:hypothetical protein
VKGRESEEENQQTYDPVHVFEEDAAFLLPPDFHTGVNINPPSKRADVLFDTFDLGSPDVRETRGRMTIKGGKSDVIKVD